MEVINLGLLPEVKASMEKVASSMLAVLKQYSQLDFSSIQKSLEQYAKTTAILRPAQKNMTELAKGLSVLIDIEILSANKSVNSGEKSANKSAIFDLSSANNDKLTEKQREILNLMDVEVEYTTGDIAEKIGLKSSRTRQLINELVLLNKVEKMGSTKDRKYKRNQDLFN